MKLVRISALWCTSCLKMFPYWQKIKETYKDYEYVEYDYDFDDEVSSFNVGNILPVIIIMKDNEEIGRIIGEKSLEEIINKIEDVNK